MSIIIFTILAELIYCLIAKAFSGKTDAAVLVGISLSGPLVAVLTDYL